MLRLLTYEMVGPHKKQILIYAVLGLIWAGTALSWGATYGSSETVLDGLPDPSKLVKEIFLPPPPQNLRGETFAAGTSLAWDPPQGDTPSAYHVYRSTQPGGPYLRVNDKPLQDSKILIEPAEDSLVSQGQTYYYVVSSQDSVGVIGLNSNELKLLNTKGSSAKTESKNSLPAEDQPELSADSSAALETADVTGKIKATARDTQVLIRWELGKGLKDITGYTIYRATGPGMELKRIKKLPAKAEEYLDKNVHTLLGDHEKAVFNYQLRALLPLEKKGAKAKEINVLKPIKVTVVKPPPEFRIPTQFKLPLKSNLKIRGEKIVSGNYEWKYFPNKEDDPATRIDERRDKLFKPEQELRVEIEGTISERVKVKVNFDDSPYLPRPRQDISIKYLGEEDDAVQEVSFGDIQLDVGKTEFVTYNPGKKLFGLKGKVKILPPLTFSALFAQTKGIPEQKIFQGAVRPVTVKLKDINYSRGRYFEITKNPASLPVGTGERIWMDDGNGSNNTGQIIEVTNGNRKFAFELLSPGLDYVIDRITGIIRLNRRITVNNNNTVLAVRFTDRNGQIQGIVGDLIKDSDYPELSVATDGHTSASQALIFDGLTYNGTGTVLEPVGRAPHYARNFYELNTSNILDPELDPGFEIIVRKSGGEDLRRTSRSNDLFLLDTEEGFIRFRDDYPFRNTSSTVPDIEYAVYKKNAVSQDSSNEIVLHYSFKSPSFKLDRINIVEGSESVFVDGRRLEKGKDYRFDYFSGNLTFKRPEEIRSDSNIVVNYEYLPFLGQFQTNLIAARMEYEPAETFRMAGTYLVNTDQKPQDFPRLGAAPSKLEIMDLEGDVTLTSEASSKFLRDLTGLKKLKIPLSIKLSGEAAQSRFNPNTYAWDLAEETLGPDHVTREKGVLMVDTMEGIGQVVGLPNSSLSYFPSGPPINFEGPPAIVFDGSSDLALNNRQKVTISEPSPRGGHVADILGSNATQDDLVDVLEVSYSGLHDGVWDGFRTVFSTTGVDLSRTRFLEMWIKGDGNRVRMTVEIGEFSEDSNGNDVLDDEDIDDNGVVPPSEDVGIPIYYLDGPIPWNRPNRQDLEDMDNDRNIDLQEEFYSYTFEVDWAGWKLLRVPVGPTEWDSALTFKAHTSDGVDINYRRIGTPNYTQIFQGRVWFTGVDSTSRSGSVQIESSDFVGNLWELNYDPDSAAAGVDTNFFDATAVSYDIDPEYPANMNFVDLREADEDDSLRLRRDEQALKLSYRLSTDDDYSGGDFCNDGFGGLRPNYFVTRTFSGIDLGAYESMHLDIYRERVDPSHLYGERLVVRFEVDDCNYYQFAVNLEDPEGPPWRVLKIPLHRQGGTVQIRGVPLLDNIKRVSVGILSNSPPPRPVVANILFINNMRFVGGVIRKGAALKTEVNFLLGNGWISATHRFREEDTGFQRLDQSNQNSQHLRRTSWDFGSSVINILGAPLKNRATLTWEEQITEPEYRNYRFYFGLPDRLSQSQTLSLGYSRALPWKAGRIELLGDVYHAQNRLTYDPSFLKSQARNNSLDQTYRTYPDVVGEKRRVSPGIVYHFPRKIAGIGMGKTSVGVKGSYETESADYPRINATLAEADRVYYRRDLKTREVWGSIRSQPLKKTNLSTRVTYEFQEVRGNTLSTVAGINQSSLIELGRWYPYQESVENKTDLKHTGVPGLTNTAKYKGKYHRAYYRDQVKVDNLVGAGTVIKPDKWFPALAAVSPSISLAREYRATAEYDPFESIYTNNLLGPDKDADGVPLINGWRLAWINPLDVRAVKDTRRKTDTAKLHMVILKNIKIDTSAQSDDATEVFRGSHPGRNLTLNLRANVAYVARVFRFGPFTLKLADLKLHNKKFSKWEASEEAILLQKDDLKSYAVRLPYGLWRDISGNFTQGTTWTRGTNRGITTKGKVIDAGFNIRWLLARTLKFNPIGWLPFIKGKVFAFKQNTDINGELKFRQSQRTSPENPKLNTLTETYSAKAGLRYKFLDNLKIDFSYKYQRVLNKIEQQRSVVVHNIFVRGTLVF